MANDNQITEWIKEKLVKKGFSVNIEKENIITAVHPEYSKLGLFSWQIVKEGKGIIMHIVAKNTFSDREFALHVVNDFNTKTDDENYWIRASLNDSNSVELYSTNEINIIEEYEKYIKEYCIEKPLAEGIKALEYFDGMTKPFAKSKKLFSGLFGKSNSSDEKMSGHPITEAELKKLAYPDTMKRILKSVAERNKGKLTQQKDNNVFLMNEYSEGNFYLTYSKDNTNPSVYVEFCSCEFEDKAKMDDMGATIVKAGISTNFNAYTNGDNTILFRKTIAIQDVEDESKAIFDISKGVDILIHAVIEIRDKWQKWPTTQEVEARRRAKAAKEEAERREREAREEAERQAEEERKREQLIKECKLDIAKYKADAAEYQAKYSRYKDDWYKEKKDRAKAEQKKAELRLQQLNAGVDLDEIDY